MGQPDPFPGGGTINGGDDPVNTLASGRQAHCPQGVLGGPHLSDRHHAEVRVPQGSLTQTCK